MFLLYTPSLRLNFVVDHFIQFFFMNVVEENLMKSVIFKIGILDFLKGAESLFVFEEYIQIVIIRRHNRHW